MAFWKLAVAQADKAPGDSGGTPARRHCEKSVTRSRVTRVEGLGVMWLDDQSHRGNGGAFELHQGGPTNFRIVSPKFNIEAKREELSVLTDLPNPIASGLGTLRRHPISPRHSARPLGPVSAVPAPGSVIPCIDPCRVTSGLLRTRPTDGV